MSESFFKTPLTRKDYWIRIIVTWIGLGIIAAIISAFTGSNGRPFMITAAVWVYWIIIQTKRLRDAGKSYVWLLLDLLMIVGIIVIGCFPSDPAARYRMK